MSKKRSIDVELYCYCRQPNDSARPMISCDFCDGWFHATCAGLNIGELPHIERWHCDGCLEMITYNPYLSKSGVLGLQGRIAPKTGWSQQFPAFEIDDNVINVETKRHKKEGWNLFREGRVQSLSSNESGPYGFFRGSCQAAMKAEEYNVNICLKKEDGKLKWAHCKCAAGVDGQCKHVVAMLYFIIDLDRRDLKTIPDVKTCTDSLQMWHVRKPLTDDPLLFSDIHFVKHDPTKKEKRELGSNIKHHNPIPDFGRQLTSAHIDRMVKVYDRNGISLPVLETIRANSCASVLPKEQSIFELHDMLFAKMSDTSFVLPTMELSPEDVSLYESLVKIDLSMSRRIEKETRMQSKSSFWFDQRQYRLTASSFGTFCKLKPTTNPVKTFQQKKHFFTTKSTHHGIVYENIAFAKYAETHTVLDSPVGLVVNPLLPFLGASPDRLVLKDNELCLVEIKCPYSLFSKKMKISRQATDKHFFLSQEANGLLFLKENHDYYYQVQGQLNLTGIDKCIFIVFVPPNDMEIFEIIRDTNFFHNAMLPKLTNIWFSHLVPFFKNA